MKSIFRLFTSVVFLFILVCRVNAQPLDETSEHGPAVAELNGKAILAWTGMDGNLNIMQSREGVDWGEKIRL